MACTRKSFSCDGRAGRQRQAPGRAVKGHTLALVSLENAGPVAGSLGQSSADLLTGEFRDRIGRFARGVDRTLEVASDKFCVLLAGVQDESQIELAGAKLRRLFEQPVSLLDHTVRAEVRAAFVPPDVRVAAGASDMEGRLRIAESGLDEARRVGRLFVIRRELCTEFEQELLQRTREVQAGLASGQFVLFFQPKVHAGYGTVVGAEGLMRWNHPKAGVLTPNHFLPLCDDLDMKRTLSWQAVKSAIAHCAGWSGDVGVAVNLPPELVADPGLNHVVGDCLAIHGLAPSRLTLEVTEDTMLADPDAAMAAISGLRRTGVRISIDDFGTGYSSLAYLGTLEVDELKIDRAFVRGIGSDERARHIVRAIIDLAHGLGMRVVAEGIEDEAVAAVIKALGCDFLQGYLYGRAMPATDFASALASDDWLLHTGA